MKSDQYRKFQVLSAILEHIYRRITGSCFFYYWNCVVFSDHQNWSFDPHIVSWYLSTTHWCFKIQSTMKYFSRLANFEHSGLNYNTKLPNVTQPLIRRYWNCVVFFDHQNWSFELCIVAAYPSTTHWCFKMQSTVKYYFWTLQFWAFWFGLPDELTKWQSNHILTLLKLCSFFYHQNWSFDLCIVSVYPSTTHWCFKMHSTPKTYS